MLNIDFLSFLKDSKIKESLTQVFKEKSNLPQHEIDAYLDERIKYHGDKMNEYIKNYLTGYNNDIKKDSNKTELDQKLDQMIEKIKLENKKFEKVD